MKSKVISYLCLSLILLFLCISIVNVNASPLNIPDHDYSEINSKSDIQFKKFKNLNAALKSASKQDKMLMLVFSATWCAPCNYMKDYVFTNKQISSFYNNNFVNVYLDADKDKAFIEQVKSKIGNVNTIPSFLFFDKEKYFVYHFEGSQTTSEFLKKGHRALDEQGYTPNTQNNSKSLTFWDKVKNIFR